jgi:micrococcal nuclease
MDTNRYGRTVWIVTVAGKTVNEELLKSGMAWFFTKYCRESFCEQWKQYEEMARSGKVGLWSMPNPVSPWDFRR